MMQELLLGSGGEGSSSTSSTYSGHGERKPLISNHGGILLAELTTAAATNNSSHDNNSNNNGINNSNSEQNLSCPRCDSSNTKFCYYNNYNLTQPRHFCKTCRRYWTKGGALRNVPIGGGCRKNKPSFTSVLPSVSKSSTITGKPTKTYSSSDDILLKSGLSNNIGLLESSLHNHYPPLWSSPPQQPQTSHLLAFLRSTQNLNPNHRHRLISSSPHQTSDQLDFNALNLLNGQNPLSGLHYSCSSFLRDNNQPLTHHQQNDVAPQLGGADQNTGIHELYQRLKPSSNSNTNSYSSGGDEDNHHAQVRVVSGSSSPECTRHHALDLAPLTMGWSASDLGLWNIPAAAYSTWTSNDHLPAATNGACPL